MPLLLIAIAVRAALIFAVLCTLERVRDKTRVGRFALVSLGMAALPLLLHVVLAPRVLYPWMLPPLAIVVSLPFCTLLLLRLGNMPLKRAASVAAIYLLVDGCFRFVSPAPVLETPRPETAAPAPAVEQPVRPAARPKIDPFACQETFRAWRETRRTWGEALGELQRLAARPGQVIQFTSLNLEGDWHDGEERRTLLLSMRLSARCDAAGSDATVANLRGYLTQTAPYRDLFESVVITEYRAAQSERSGDLMRVFTLQCRTGEPSPPDDIVDRASAADILKEADAHFLPDATSEAAAGRAVSLLSRYADVFGLTAGDIRETEREPGPALLSVPSPLAARVFQVEMHGAYEALVAMVRALERANPYIFLRSLDLVPSGDRPEKLKASLRLGFPAWGEPDRVAALREAEGLAPPVYTPPYMPYPPGPGGWRDPFWPRGFIPGQREKELAEEERERNLPPPPGYRDEDWLAARQKVSVSGIARRPDGRGIGIIDGRVVSEGETVTVRSQGFEYTWRVKRLDRKAGAEFERVSVERVE
jgi:hypothetical protein